MDMASLVSVEGAHEATFCRRPLAARLPTASSSLRTRLLPTCLGGDYWFDGRVDGDRIWFGGSFSASVYRKDATGFHPVVAIPNGRTRIAGTCGPTD